MTTLKAIFTNIEAGTPGMNEAIFCVMCVIVIAAICYFLPDTSKKVVTNHK